VLNDQLTLRDGRRLGVATFGAPNGPPVIYCHGFPASRLEAALADDAAKRVGARLIAFDRPGYGLSDFMVGRRISDWPADVMDAADKLGLDRFAVLGVSGGAPYALACAASNGERVTAVGIVGGLGPACPGNLASFNAFARLSFALGRSAPALSRAINRTLGMLIRGRPELMMRLLAGTLPQCDRDVLKDPDVYAKLRAALRDAFRQGGKAAAYEFVLYAQYREIPDCRGSPVYVFHGECDTTVPVRAGRRMAAQLRGCRAAFYPNEGHYSLPLRHMDEILGRLIDHR